MFLSEAPDSSGKRTSGVSGRFQVFPKSSVHASSAPKCMLEGPAQIRCRPPRSSYAAPYTDAPGKKGPVASQRPRDGDDRSRKRPFIVPTSRSTSPWRTERGAGALIFLAGMGKSLFRPAPINVRDFLTQLVEGAVVDDHVLRAQARGLGGQLGRDAPARVLAVAAALQPTTHARLLGGLDQEHADVVRLGLGLEELR